MAAKKEKVPPSTKPGKAGAEEEGELALIPLGEGRKWSKGKEKEKMNNAVLFDQASYDKLLAGIPKYKLITPSVLSERLRISGALTRKAIRELMARGSIRMHGFNTLEPADIYQGYKHLSQVQGPVAQWRWAKHAAPAREPVADAIPWGFSPL